MDTINNNPAKVIFNEKMSSPEPPINKPSIPKFITLNRTAADDLQPVKDRLLELQSKFIAELDKIISDCEVVKARIKGHVTKTTDTFNNLALMFNDTVQKSREMVKALNDIQKEIGD